MTIAWAIVSLTVSGAGPVGAQGHTPAPDLGHASAAVRTVGPGAAAHAGDAQAVVGRAAHIGNDYPYETIGQFEHQDQGTDPWNEYEGQCDSFAAWKAYENLQGAGAVPSPPSYPDRDWVPPNASISNIDQNTWGNAGDWVASAAAHGWKVDDVPAPGAIVIWSNGHIGSVGHVGYVDDVYPDGSITIENYNLHVNGEYSKFHLAYGGGPETSFGATYQIPWPDGFAHIGDGPATASDGSVLSPQTAPTGTEYGYQYSPDVPMAGPGSPAGQFATTGNWQTRTGHGELGNMLWAPTSGSPGQGPLTASWDLSGLVPGACYKVDAFIPDSYADVPSAAYQVGAADGTHSALVDQNAVTNDWAPLDTYRATAAGSLTVRLDNRGASGLYVAADAMRFLRQTTC